MLETTGVCCPFCGLTRGTFSLLKGNIIEAFLYNPLVFFVGAFVLWRVVLFFYIIFKGEPLILKSHLLKKWWLCLAITSVFVFGYRVIQVV